MDSVCLVCNPAAHNGKSLKVLAKVEALLAARGLAYQVVKPSSPGAVASEISSAVSHRGRRVLLVGGDGLIHHALPALAMKDLQVGLIPAGTGNDFARAFSIPKNTTKAVEIALNQTQPIDLMQINLDTSAPVWVASVVTGGFSAVVNESAEKSRLNGSVKYTAATLKGSSLFSVGVG